MYNGWTWMDHHGSHISNTIAGRTANAYQGTRCRQPQISSCKHSKEPILWKQSAITTVPHVIGIFLLTLSPCPILKASDAINHANDLPTCRAGGKASQLHKSKVEENSAWCEVNLCPLTAQEDDREVPQRGEMSQCPHN